MEDNNYKNVKKAVNSIEVERRREGVGRHNGAAFRKGKEDGEAISTTSERDRDRVRDRLIGYP